MRLRAIIFCQGGGFLKYADEKQVLKALNIGSWRNLSKDTFMKYMALVPDIDKETQLRILEHAPEILSFTKDMVEAMRTQQESAINKATDVTNKTIEALNAIQENFENMGNAADLTFEERTYFCDKQMELAHLYMRLDETHKKSVGEYLKTGLAYVGGALLLVLSGLLGIKVFGGSNDGA